MSADAAGPREREIFGIDRRKALLTGGAALAGAEAVYVGSEHIRDVLDEVCGHVERVEIVPPGVDVDEFWPELRDEALAAPTGAPRRTWFAKTRSAGPRSRSTAAFASTYASRCSGVKSVRYRASSPS